MPVLPVRRAVILGGALIRESGAESPCRWSSHSDLCRTSIKREAGKDISVTCTLEVLSGTAKVFWISGADEAVTLLETTGTYSDTITLPDGGNYIGIECEDFTGKIEMNIK